MRVEELATWVAAGLAIIAVALAAWQLRKAYQRARTAEQNANRIHALATEAESQATRAEREAQHASSQARWAWEQVKLASSQLEQAQSEHHASSEAEHWEWSYALTTCAREAVDASSELLRVALDSQVAPQYRIAAERHYTQTTTRWQETMTKALARTEPTLELQQQVLTFTQIQHRLHGYLGVLMRAAETGTLGSADALTNQALASGQELETARRQLQRTVSATLASAHMSGGATGITAQPTRRVKELASAPVSDLDRPAPRPEATRQQLQGSLGQAPEQQPASRQSGSRRNISRSPADAIRMNPPTTRTNPPTNPPATRTNPPTNPPTTRTNPPTNPPANQRGATGTWPPVAQPNGAQPAPPAPDQNGRRGR